MFNVKTTLVIYKLPSCIGMFITAMMIIRSSLATSSPEKDQRNNQIKQQLHQYQPNLQQQHGFLNDVPASENSLEQDLNPLFSVQHKLVDCGTIASNHTRLIVKNPHHPEPTFVKAICETVIERSHPRVDKLTIKFKQLELYRPNYDGSCMHDRFAVYTDLNIAVTPVICGNQTGKIVTIPFRPPQTSLIVSITTSDLDHDRAWVLEIEQEKWT